MIVTERMFPSVMGRLAQIPQLTWDLETDGLYPYRGNRLFSCAVLAAGERLYFPFRHKRGVNLPGDYMVDFLDELTNGHELLGFNSVRFDGPMVAIESDHLYTRLLSDDRLVHRDVILMALLANENEESFSLDNLGQKYLGFDVAVKRAHKAQLLLALQAVCPKKTKSERVLMGYLSHLTPEQVCAYAEADVVDTEALAKKYQPCLDEWGLNEVFAKYCRVARLLAKIERQGLRVDREECARRSESCTREQLALGEILTRRLGINPGSPTQVARLLGTDDAEADTILASKHPSAVEIVKYRKLGKVASTYYDAMLNLSNAEGIIHPQMNLSRDPRDKGGTKGGRLSCSSPNFQNLPVRSDEPYMRVRECVIARPGMVLLKNDYQRAEMWMAGYYSGDQSLVDAYMSDRDLYTELAEQAGCSRQDGKVGWLMIQYGAGAQKIAEYFGWPHTTVATFETRFGMDAKHWGRNEWSTYMAQPAAKLKRSFFELCPGIKDVMKRIETAAEEDGHIRLWSGRAIHFDHHFTHPYQGWNRLIQGGVGEMVTDAMLALEQPLETVGAYQVLSVHDEIVAEAPEENAVEAARICREVMTNFPQFAPFIPRVDSKTGENYGRME